MVQRVHIYLNTFSSKTLEDFRCEIFCKPSFWKSTSFKRAKAPPGDAGQKLFLYFTLMNSSGMKMSHFLFLEILNIQLNEIQVRQNLFFNWKEKCEHEHIENKGRFRFYYYCCYYVFFWWRWDLCWWLWGKNAYKGEYRTVSPALSHSLLSVWSDFTFIFFISLLPSALCVLLHLQNTPAERLGGCHVPILYLFTKLYSRIRKFCTFTQKKIHRGKKYPRQHFVTSKEKDTVHLNIFYYSPFFVCFLLVGKWCHI